MTMPEVPETTYLEREMRESYLDYAMSVIVGRALPDVRDGMKPVHRRVLYAMRQAGNDYNKPYKKSARIVGDVLGKFHPHGQEAVYDAIVRMAQPFSMRYMLVDGLGNFGSVDGDAPAAMRYTEVRMARIAHAMMTDIDKETVDMMPNYDGSELEPKVLCPTFPALVVNGSSGIAVGMATNLPPHNMNDAVAACQLLLKKPDAGIKEVIRRIKAPDFPTAGIIHGMRGVREAYETGRGRVTVRARAEIEQIDKGKRSAIIVTELPYMVNKATLIERIAESVREKRLVGISDLRDESDRTGMRIVIEVKRDANPEVLLNNLYKGSAMQSNFAVNSVALVHGVPLTLNIKDMVLRFLEHRREVVYRRTLFDLERARERALTLEGFAVAVSIVEEIIAAIKNAASPAEAKATLLAREWRCETVVKMLAALKDPQLARLASEPGPWGLQPAKRPKQPTSRLSARQAQSILEMRLQRLTAIEREKVMADYRDTVAKIVDFLAILDQPERVTEIVAQELDEAKKMFGDKRRTEIDEIGEDIDDEDLIEKEDFVVTLSHSGYIKATKLSEFRTQHRGGTGKAGASLKDEDFISDLKVANSHSTVLFLTSRGRLYWQKVYRLPASSRSSRGRPIVNLLDLMDGERVQAMLAVDDLNVTDVHVVMATRNGVVKKTPLQAYAKPRSRGIIAINIDDGDELIAARLASAQDTVMLFTDGGKAVRFEEGKLRPLGRGARGVRGIRIQDGHRCVSMVICRSDESAEIVTITERGTGKRTPVTEYAIKSRGIQGVTNLNKSPATGKVVCCLSVEKGDELMLITAEGRLIRIKASTVRRTGRTAQGVKVIEIGNDKLVDAARIEERVSLDTRKADQPGLLPE